MYTVYYSFNLLNLYLLKINTKHSNLFVEWTSAPQKPNMLK